MLPCPEDNRSFFAKLQKAEDLDLRDTRGKRHDLAVVLVAVTLAILSNRDGCLSSLHRHLVNHYEKLVEVLGIEKKQPVSRSQLPLILEKVRVRVFDQLIFDSFGVRLNQAEHRWFAVDGKELRGSIRTNQKRGAAALVQGVTHETCQVAAQDYYSGEKESEVPVVRRLLKDSRLAAEKISLDALHCKPATLEIITAEKGKYVVGLKANQKELKKQICRAIENQSFLCQTRSTEKAHGRIEIRSYEFYDVLELEKEPRWNQCQIKTAVKVSRERKQLKSGKRSCETSYYVTNEVGNYEEMAAAIRGHWQVETNNHLRDVSLKEDKMRSKKSGCSKQWQA